MKSRLSLLFAIILFANTVVGQDIQFSQFYTNLLYTNPAFAGSAHHTRLMTHNRVQWAGIDARYLTFMGGIDHFIYRSGTGVGLFFVKDIQGRNVYTTDECNMQLSQELHLTSKVSMRLGVQGTYFQKSLDYSTLIFPDQINDKGLTSNPTNQPLDFNRINFLDISSGVVLYTNHLWVGYAYRHMNTPSVNVASNNYSLPYQMAINGGYKIYLVKNDPGKIVPDKEFYISPSAQYKAQGKSDQYDIGVYSVYHHFLFGIWYRGLPIIKKYREGLQNNESTVAQLGYRHQQFSVNYSYDYTVSKLHMANTGGSHELNITYVFGKPTKKTKPMKKIPCPDLYSR